MRVLFYGDMMATGFGTVTMDLGRRLISRGLDVRFISQNDLDTLDEPFASRTLSIPSLIQVVDQASGKSLVDDARNMSTLLRDAGRAKMVNGKPWGDWQSDGTVLLGDIQNVRFQLAATPDLAAAKALHYVPIEGRSLPRALKDDIWAVCQPVAMSNFGADEIAKVMGARPPMIYHGVDTTAFHPVKPSNPLVMPGNKAPIKFTTKDQCKSFWAAWFGMKLPRKWMLRTDRHMPRKRYNSMLRALQPVLYYNPDTLMIVHCRHTDFGGSLPDTISNLADGNVRRVPSERVLHPDIAPPEGYALFGRDYPQIILTNLSGLTREQLVSLINSVDLYLSTSAEGFGLTIAEALACGVPAVGLDYSAVPEVIGNAGVTVPIAYEFDNEYDHFWAAVDEQRFAHTVHTLLNDPAQRDALGRKGPRHVRAHFSWDTAADQFADLLQASVLEEAA